MSRTEKIKIGDKFSKLTVVDFVGVNKHRKRVWLCRCDCGNMTSVTTGQLIGHHSTSCGCTRLQNSIKATKISNTKHGMKGTKEYKAWSEMKQRCINKNAQQYKNYGARGIKVCDRWLQSFENFYADMGKAPDGFSIDRIDVNGDYCPENCRWVTNSVQSRNKRNSIPLEEKNSVCPICGKTFEKSQRNGEKACSISCGAKLRAIKHLEETKDKYKKTCPICGKEFDDRSGHYKDRVYCSKKCKNISLSPVWEYNGESLHVVEWAERLGMTSHALLNRKRLGWSIEEILTTPCGGKRNVKM